MRYRIKQVITDKIVKDDEISDVRSFVLLLESKLRSQNACVQIPASPHLTAVTVRLSASAFPSEM